MSDDLVKRLREHAIHLDAWGKEAIHDADIVEEAANHIEKLEAALREIVAVRYFGLEGADMESQEMRQIARKALEEKDD